MLTIILAAVIGVIFTLIAVDNSQEIGLNLFGSFLSFPLYLILVISFFAGVLVSSIFTLFDWTTASFDLKKKENSYKNALRVNDELRGDIQKLNKENTELRQNFASIKAEHNERKVIERKANIKNFFHKITHPNRSSTVDSA